MTTATGSRMRCGLLVTAYALAAGAGVAVGQTDKAPPGVVCAGTTPQYGYGPAYGSSVPSYGIGSATVTGTRDTSRMTFHPKQLLINQRISQAAIRRVQAIQEWLDAGIVAGDICGGALGPEDFSGITVELGAPGATRPAPKPRALKLGQVGGGNPSRVRLTRAQLIINQRISQTAVRRVNALRARLARGLTGGDVVNGTLSPGTLRVGMRIVDTTAVTALPASITSIPRATPGNPARVTLTKKQLLINQRISQAAVRRSNAIIAHLRTGLNGDDFRDGALTPADLAQGVVTP